MEQSLSRRAMLGALGTAVAATAGCQTPGMGSESSEDSADQSSQAATDQSDSVYTDVYQEVADAVVSIRVYAETTVGGQGSGFLIDDEHIVTNEHVVAGGSEYYVRFADTGWRSATVVGADVYSDLAVLRVGSTPDVTPLSFVETEPTVGTEVVAIGNPFGLSGSVSAGIISGVDRTLQSANNFSIADAVQTDAPVNPGNSGGPLVTLDGDVVGVINSGGGDNVAFAISAPLTQRVVPSLIQTGDYDHPYMGVGLQSVSPRIAEANNLDPGSGVYISRVVDGGPAAGVLQGSDGSTTVSGTEIPTGGDVVRQMDETPTPTRQALGSFLALETSPGETVDVLVERDGTQETVELTLGTRPEP
ncbi:trypsin-like peptidase domain-containing protein [Haloarcula sp. S1AR25-5A]|uniref:Trypsin-like peptidase domain-containing protein n=1 Tax=Haloarcula terrestris TaxID=2950533 RepID=A0AAE4F011_9EURY|nr:trypsin-like peptidase domain-containing protein [Haloarcula terrestris]MDS0222534.1 trypsin-like peptidase domain-containing protein [Haloarcula terrestris]